MRLVAAAASFPDALRSARLDLAYTNIRAPVSGRIGRLEVTTGNLVSAGAGSPVLARMVSVDPIYASFDADEATVDHLLSAPGALERVPVEMDLAGGATVEGHIQLIDPSVDPANGTVGIRVAFSNADGALLPGQFARIRLGEANAAPAILVAERAVGTDQDTGALRFTFGFPDLMDGVDFIPVAMGMFGIADIFASLAEQRGPEPLAPTKITSLWPSREEFRQAWKPALRGTAIGSLFGVLPGGGPTISTFASYTIEKRIAKHPERFGHGAVEGVAGPESANNAAAQTAFIPMLTLGIPSNAVLAIMAASMTIHGITPGPAVMTKTPALFWGMIASMWIGNLMLLILNLPLIGIWVKLLSAPYRLLYPAILLFCAVGVYSVKNNVHDVGMMTLFGIVGYVLIRLEADPAPLLLGLVLGPMMEQNLRRAMVIADGDWTVFVRKPISATLLAMAALLVVAIIVPNIRRARDAARAFE